MRINEMKIMILKRRKRIQRNLRSLMLKNVNNIVNDIIHVVYYVFLYFYLRHLLLKRHRVLHYIVEIVLYRFICEIIYECVI